jgi:hypothetical protein
MQQRISSAAIGVQNLFKNMIQVLAYINLSLEAKFTPAVFWHYIGSQYFPLRTLELAKNPHDSLKKIEEIIDNEKLENLDLLTLDIIVNLHASKTNPEVIQGSEKEISDFKTKLTISEVISATEQELEICSKEIKEIRDNIGHRLSHSYDKLQATNADSLLFRSKEIMDYDESISRIYSQRTLEDFDKQSKMVLGNDESIMQETVYYSPIEAGYFGCLEKQAQKDTPSKSLSSKQEGGNSFQKNLNTTSLKSVSRKPGHDRINAYIQNYKNSIKQVDDTVCQVCNDGNYDIGNNIVFCAVLPYLFSFL